MSTSSGNRTTDERLPDKWPSQYDIPAEEISFLEQPNNKSYCICLVDIVGSTKIITEMTGTRKVRKYYSIFLNSMAAISKNFGAKVIKNIGDALLFYFPTTSDSDNQTAFKEVMECCTAIIVARDLMQS